MVDDPVNPKPNTQSADKMGVYDDLIGRIGEAINDLIHLEVTTLVGNTDKVNLSQSTKNVISGMKDPKALYTRIGLLDGDITTVIDEKFVPEGELSNLRAFHQERVKEGGDIIKRNLEALQKLLDMAKSIRDEA